MSTTKTDYLIFFFYLAIKSLSFPKACIVLSPWTVVPTQLKMGDRDTFSSRFKSRIDTLEKKNISQASTHHCPYVQEMRNNPTRSNQPTDNCLCMFYNFCQTLC
jgi:hypothetical protein